MARRRGKNLFLRGEALLSTETPPFLALIGLQRTKHDASVHLRMHASCNDFSSRLRTELDAGKRTPDFRVRLRIHVGVIFRPDDSEDAKNLVAEGKMVDGAELPPHPTGEVYVRVEEQNGLPLTCISSLMVTLPPEYNYYRTDYMSSCINAKTLRGETWNGRVSCTISDDISRLGADLRVLAKPVQFPQQWSAPHIPSTTWPTLRIRHQDGVRARV